MVFNFTFIIVMLLVFSLGMLLGYLLTRTLGCSNDPANKIVKRQLTAKEVELSQVRAEVSQHFVRTAEGLASLAKQLNNLQIQLTTDTQTLASKTEVSRILSVLAEADKTGELARHTANSLSLTNANLDNIAPPKDYASSSEGGTLTEGFGALVEPPRDYAPNSGTLAEDFGLHAKTTSKLNKKKKKKKKDKAKQD